MEKFSKGQREMKDSGGGLAPAVEAHGLEYKITELILKHNKTLEITLRDAEQRCNAGGLQEDVHCHWLWDICFCKRSWQA